MAGVVPRRHWRDRLSCADGNIWKLSGLEPKGERIYGLADGSEHRMSITTGDVEFMGEVVGATIVMGDEEFRAVVGCYSVGSRQELRSIRGIRSCVGCRLCG